MPAKASEMDRAAAEAARLLERAEEIGAQLDLLGEPVPVDPDRKRGPKKARSRVSAWLAHKGYASPIERLAKHAGLHRKGDPLQVAMAEATMIEDWALRGEVDAEGVPLRLSPGQRVGLLQDRLSEMRRATEALAPYTAQKVTPDQVDNRQQMIVNLPGAGAPGSVPGAASPGALLHAFAPPPMPGEKGEGNQGVIEGVAAHSDSGGSDE